jgi:alpha,alpha-trehalase
MPEKFDLETSSHKVFAEYGKCRAGLIYISKEGFGWVVMPIWFRCLMLI